MKRETPPPARQADRRGKMLEVLGLFRVVFKSIRKHYQSVERRTGVRGAQLWALAQVAEKPGLRVGDLARSLAIHQSTASNLLRDLVAAELVIRKRTREDRRTVRLHATNQGLDVLRRAPRPLIGVLQQALADLPGASLTALHRHLDRLILAMRAADRSARGTPLSEL